MKYLFGIDIGSSSVKVSLLDIATGNAVASTFSPVNEMIIQSRAPGHAEQNPDSWWEELINASKKLHNAYDFRGEEIAAIGISYQMHGLVAVDADGRPVRPSIIWCDGRAVQTGNDAFLGLGEKFCLEHYLNSPGNFTASKLKWVKENEPDIYKKIYKIMLPGDYIAYRLTNLMATTISGLSEGIMWDFTRQDIATELLDYYDIDRQLIPAIVPQFGEQGRVSAEAASILGLKAGIPVCYRAGDQPNNAYSLNALEPGEIAATAGTSGVVYGVTDKTTYDPQSRVNTFVHVNHQASAPRSGILLCVNGTGSMNSWLRKNVFPDLNYEKINALAAEIEVGCDGLLCYPFGNGAERVLGNADPGAWMEGIQFNRHDRRHMARAAQEGIVFSLQYGMEVMQQMGMDLKTIRAGHANMFLSEIFANAFANTSGCKVELYNTDGSIGAARAAGVGAGVFKTYAESFSGMKQVKAYEPERESTDRYAIAYSKWKEGLKKRM